MRAHLEIIVLFALISTGCTSSRHLSWTEDLARKLEPDQTLVVSLHGGTTIELEPYHYIYVSEPSDFLYGIAEVTYPHSSTRRIRPGKYDLSSFDSVKLYNVGTLTRYVCYSRDSTCVLKCPDNVLVSGLGGAGLWCIGVQKNTGGATVFRGRLDEGLIESISIKEPAPVTSLFAILGLIFGGLIVLASIAFSRSSL